MHACCAVIVPLPAAKAGVNVSYSRGMDIAGEIHYDWPLESTLEVRGPWRMRHKLSLLDCTQC